MILRSYPLATRNQGSVELVIEGTLFAFCGAFIGSRLVKKITLRTILVVVWGMLLLVGLSIGTGLI